MHLDGPVPERIHDHLQHARVLQVQRVAGAGDVLVIATILLQSVVGQVIDAAERQRRAEVAAFTGMVVDNIEDHFDPGVVQPLDRRLELGDRSRHQKPGIRREKRDRIVAPVIGQALFGHVALGGGGMDRGRRARRRCRAHARPRPDAAS